MHRHEDLQFVHVLSGAVEVATLSDRIFLQSGEGAFINKSMVHTVQKDGACHYNSFTFPDRFVKSYPGGSAECLVDRSVGRSELPVLAIRSSGGRLRNGWPFFCKTLTGTTARRCR